MELIERYLQSVEIELNAPDKENIIRELRSNLADEIESLQSSNDALGEDEAVSQVLKKYGHPVQVAESFQATEPLVASCNMRFYKKILSIGASLVFLLAVVKSVSLLISLDSINPFRFLFIILGTFLENIGIVVIAITIAFYFLGKHADILKWRYKNWQPNTLPKNPSVKTSVSDSITDLTSSLFLLLLVTIPFWMSSEAQQNLIFGLAQDKQYWRYVLGTLCVLSIVNCLYHFTQYSWTKISLLAYIFDNALFAIVFFVMALQPDLLIINVDLTTMLAENPEGFRWAKAFLDTGLKYVLIVTGVIAASVAIYYCWLLSKLK